MRYEYPDSGFPQPSDVGCRVYTHTWSRRFPMWRALLGLPQTCHRCGMKRYAR